MAPLKDNVTVAEYQPEKTDYPEPPRSYSWQEVWTLAISRPSAEQFRSLLNDPRATANRGVLWLLLAGFINGLVTTVVVNQSLPVIAQQQQLPLVSLSPLEILFISLFLGPILVFAVALIVGIYHMVARFLGGAGLFADLFYLYASYTAPLFILLAGITVAPIPDSLKSILSFIWGVYQFLLSAIVIRAVYRLDWLKVVAIAFLVPFILGMILQMFVPL